jgi:hypothetical protein
MPKTHGQPKASPPSGTHTKGQPKASGKGSPTTHHAQLKKQHG